MMLKIFEAEEIFEMVSGLKPPKYIRPECRKIHTAIQKTSDQVSRGKSEIVSSNSLNGRLVLKSDFGLFPRRTWNRIRSTDSDPNSANQIQESTRLFAFLEWISALQF